jgi:cardiolipin synthase
MSERFLNIPNSITLLRLLAVPVVVWLILHEHWQGAFWVFLAAAMSDGVDGLLARLLKQMTALGAALDTIADKLLSVVTLVLLTLAEAIPLWVALAILLRDTVIVLGALSYRGLAGHIEMQPTLLGKTHIALEFTLLTLVLAHRAHIIELGSWQTPLFLAVFGIAVVSGLQYVWIWSAKARRERLG